MDACPRFGWVDILRFQHVVSVVVSVVSAGVSVVVSVVLVGVSVVSLVFLCNRVRDASIYASKKYRSSFYS